MCLGADTYLDLKEQNWWLITCQMISSGAAMAPDGWLALGCVIDGMDGMDLMRAVGWITDCNALNLLGPSINDSRLDSKIDRMH